jgi:hypothetical protein
MNIKNVANLRLADSQFFTPEASKTILKRPKNNENKSTTCRNLLVAYAIFIF